jgi:hypothetical protein
VFGGIQPDKLTGYLEESADALGNNGMVSSGGISAPFDSIMKISDAPLRTQHSAT